MEIKSKLFAADKVMLVVVFTMFMVCVGAGIAASIGGERFDAERFSHNSGSGSFATAMERQIV